MNQNKRSDIFSLEGDSVFTHDLSALFQLLDQAQQEKLTLDQSISTWIGTLSKAGMVKGRGHCICPARYNDRFPES